MFLQKNKCVISSIKNSEEGVAFSNLSYDDLQNLTETHLYQADMPSVLRFAIEYDGQKAGEISLKSIRWFNHKAEVAVFIHKPFRGKGLAEEALRMLIHYAFHTMNFYRIEAEVVAYNPAAKVVFEKLGFKQEGVLREAKYFNGEYHDIYSYGLLAREWKSK